MITKFSSNYVQQKIRLEV